MSGRGPPADRSSEAATPRAPALPDAIDIGRSEPVRQVAERRDSPRGRLRAIAASWSVTVSCRAESGIIVSGSSTVGAPGRVWAREVPLRGTVIREISGRTLDVMQGEHAGGGGRAQRRRGPSDRRHGLRSSRICALSARRDHRRLDERDPASGRPLALGTTSRRSGAARLEGALAAEPVHGPTPARRILVKIRGRVRSRSSETDRVDPYRGRPGFERRTRDHRPPQLSRVVINQHRGVCRGGVRQVQGQPVDDPNVPGIGFAVRARG